MSTDGVFEIEENDVITLNPDCSHFERTGWVNVGVHAVHIRLNGEGTLVISTYARTNESETIRSLCVTQDEATAKGGIDPDA
jgi:hypothetical protein